MSNHKIQIINNLQKPTCSIFIPAYNAEKTIESVLMRIPDEAWRHICKIFVINDGSLDKTVDVIERLKIIYPKIELFSFDSNKGYGSAVSKGLELCSHIESDYFVCLHADGQYPPEKIIEFLNYMRDNKIDILQGSRHKNGTALAGGMPLYKYIAGKCLVWLENIVFGLKMSDYHSGYIFYSRHALSEIPFNKMSSSYDFDLEIIAMGKECGLIISELGIPTLYANEISYLNPIVYGFQVLRILYRYLTGYYHALRQYN